jgi:hypothetical protein
MISVNSEEKYISIKKIFESYFLNKKKLGLLLETTKRENY